MTNDDIELLISEVKSNIRCVGPNLVQSTCNKFTISSRTHTTGLVTYFALHEDSTILIGSTLDEIIWKMIRYITALEDN